MVPITKNTTGIRGIYITITSTTMVFANEKTRFTTITVSRILLQLLQIYQNNIIKKCGKFTMKVCIDMVKLLRVLYLYITFNKNVILIIMS